MSRAWIRSLAFFRGASEGDFLFQPRARSGLVGLMPVLRTPRCTRWLPRAWSSRFSEASWAEAESVYPTSQSIQFATSRLTRAIVSLTLLIGATAAHGSSYQREGWSGELNSFGDLSPWCTVGKIHWSSGISLRVNAAAAGGLTLILRIPGLGAPFGSHVPVHLFFRSRRTRSITQTARVSPTGALQVEFPPRHPVWRALRHAPSLTIETAEYRRSLRLRGVSAALRYLKRCTISLARGQVPAGGDFGENDDLRRRREGPSSFGFGPR